MSDGRNAAALDSETHRVREVLEGARKGKRDPDVELFQILAELELGDSAKASEHLTRLVRDADQD